MSQTIYIKIKKAVLLLLQANLVLLLSSCGKTAYNVAPTIEKIVVGGSFSTPPQTDIVMVVDDTGSMFQAYPAIKDQFPQFLSTLDVLGFNYHATIIPMTTYMKVTQAVGSVYDVNSSTFKPSYPGDTGAGSGMLPASIFRTPINYNAYVNQTQMSSSLNGMEPTLQNIAAMLATGFVDTGFFRSSAMPILIFLGNGNDTSGINYGFRSPDNNTVADEEISGTPLCQPTAADPIKGGSTTCGSQATSLSYYESLFSQMLPSLKVYAVVANTVSRSCLGGNASTKVGTRYQALASYFGGRVLDLCSAGGPGATSGGMIGAVLKDMSSYLQAQKQLFQINYLILKPNEVPSQVTRLVGGNSTNTQVIPTDSTQPLYWTYAGQITNQNTVQLPDPSGKMIQMNPASGNAIQFHVNVGGVLPTTADTFNVQETPPGSTNSVSN